MQEDRSAGVAFVINIQNEWLIFHKNKGALGLKFYSICTTIKIRVVVRIGG